MNHFSLSLQLFLHFYILSDVRITSGEMEKVVIGKAKGRSETSNGKDRGKHEKG